MHEKWQPPRHAAIFGLAMLGLIAPPSMAQNGRIATSTVGQVGERETRDQPSINIASTARIDNRINNRVQSRIRNRIDRNYDPQANAVSPFAIAEEQIRTTNRPGRR